MRVGVEEANPRIFLVKPLDQGLLLKGPDPHGEGAELQDGGGMAEAWVGGGGGSELSSPFLQSVVGTPGLWPVMGFEEGWGCGGVGSVSFWWRGMGSLVHPRLGEGWDPCAFRKAVSGWLAALSSGCLEFLSPWSLDSLTFPVSEEAVYSQKVIHS